MEFVGKLEAVAFRLDSGRIVGIPVRAFNGLDGTPVTRVALADGGDTVVIEQFSGNQLEVPWEVVRGYPRRTARVRAASGSAPRT